MASRAEKSQNLLVVCCHCLLSNSFCLGRRKRYPCRKCSYGNRKRALLIRINKTDLSFAKECLCVRCSHVVATVSSIHISVSPFIEQTETHMHMCVSLQ